MKDKDTQFLFESYLQSIEEGRKKTYTDRERKTVVDPATGEERKESYYEMMMRLKGKGSGVRSRANRQRKEKRSNKVELGKREFKVADKAYEERLNSAQKDIIRFVEADSKASAKDILSFLKKIGMEDKEAKTLLGGMITDGFLDEVFKNSIDSSATLDDETEVDLEPTSLLDTDTEGSESDLADATEQDLEDI